MTPAKNARVQLIKNEIGYLYIPTEEDLKSEIITWTGNPIRLSLFDLLMMLLPELFNSKPNNDDSSSKEDYAGLYEDFLTQISHYLEIDGYNMDGNLACLKPFLDYLKGRDGDSGRDLYDCLLGIFKNYLIEVRNYEEDKAEKMAKNTVLELPYRVNSRSIRTEIEFKSSKPKNDRILPLFYYKQGSCTHVSINEMRNSHSRSAYIEISGIKFSSGDFRICEPNDGYLLTVNLDKDVSGKLLAPYFEFFANAVAVNSDKAQIDWLGEHRFGPDAQTFYIGCDPSKKVKFDGTIQRLVFDPNASCTTCP